MLSIGKDTKFLGITKNLYIIYQKMDSLMKFKKSSYELSMKMFLLLNSVQKKRFLYLKINAIFLFF
ncbi:hypothetical protein CGC56_04270 [Capnocytophaga canimorsus]|uniref:Uncharacterized protein n=1 Tax=Capnocytophaga canimorsus TaxID=28188 RepID=A0A250G541_9FLAO|nr:hypothetical protein CGC56_04270 [Capnocytophaga canimorsus]